MTTNTTPSQAASIDTPEFRMLTRACLNSTAGDYRHKRDALIAHIDAKLAQAWNDGDAAGMTMMRETIQKSLCDEFGVPHIEGPEQTYIMVEAAIKEKMEALLIRAECAEECFDKLTASDNEWRDRAIAAESRLAEIQRGIKALKTQRRRARILGTNVMDEEYFFYVGDVLALLQPQGQADTSGLPG